MARKDGHEVIPGAWRLIKSLRDMGYEFEAAVADLIDNSIEAGARTIRVDLQFEGDDSWVRIADDGKGMAPDELREAMRYGSERDYAKDDLGKFGLGLKTASMSQCERLSVATRHSKERARVAAYCWDLEHVKKTNKWEILPLDDAELGPVVCDPLSESTGTVVLWQRLDRILGLKHPYGPTAQKRLINMCRDLEEHVSMVFHRFLSGESGRRKLKIIVNGNEVRPWDPFCRDEEHTEELDSVEVDLEHEGVSGAVKLRPFILPAQSQFSSPEAFRIASGPSNWNAQQGFYIYRADRMIQSGGWSNFRTADEHTKLARIAVDFAPKLDDAFKINVAKMRVSFPAQARDAVKDVISEVAQSARRKYGRKDETPSSPGFETASALTFEGNHERLISEPTSVEPVGLATESSPVPTVSPPKAQRTSERPSHVEGQAVRAWTLDDFARRLLDCCTDDERVVVRRALAKLMDSLAPARQESQ